MQKTSGPPGAPPRRGEGAGRLRAVLALGEAPPGGLGDGGSRDDFLCRLRHVPRRPTRTGTGARPEDRGGVPRRPAGIRPGGRREEPGDRARPAGPGRSKGRRPAEGRAARPRRGPRDARDDVLVARGPRSSRKSSSGSGHLRKGGSLAERAESLIALGATLQRRGQLKEAEPVLREALTLRIKDRGEFDKAVAECMTTLAIVLKDQGNTREAISLIERSLAIEEKVAPGSDAVLESRNELANILIESTSDYQKAIALHAQNLVDLRKYYGESHPYVALALNNIARAETDSGRYADADRHFQEALALQRKIYGGPHPETALTRHNYGFLRLDEGRLEEAEALTREALEMRRSVLPKGHSDLAVSLNNLGLIVKRRGHLDEAEACYRESLEITRAADGEDSLEIPVTLMNLGGIYRDKGEFAKAEPSLEDALARDRKFFLSPNVALVRDMTSLAQTKTGLKKYSRRRRS
ncbi:MAG: tetratricopeptide repeat protein [Holophagales bacterium]|nr:tetratricopeptide repeat protein [Holophagales bacterium]